jgi:hypothetical protein
MKGKIQIHCVRLEDLANQLKEASHVFETISFTHVYHEHNMLADALSKQGQQVGSGLTILEESISGTFRQSRSSVF